MRITRTGMIVGWGCCDVPKARSIDRLRREEDAERGDELRQRRGGAQRPEDRELDHDADHDHDHVGEHDRRAGWGA